MQLRAGQEQPWPLQSQTLLSGELLLVLQQLSPQGSVLERQALVSLTGQAVLPGRPAGLDATSELRIRALNDCELEPLESDAADNDQELRQRLNAAPPSAGLHPAATGFLHAADQGRRNAAADRRSSRCEKSRSARPASAG